ncbi:MAG: NifU family protein [Myxococcota bacterium]|nr:NifU family protein [Myxococcota bacterium]
MSESRPERSLEALVGDLESLERVVESWDEPGHRQAVQALRTTLEDIQAGAFRRLIQSVKASPEGLAALRAAVDDPWVFNVLSYHGLLRPPEPSLHDRIEAALASVRPALAGHEGDVELVSVDPPEVRIRLLGTCDGCSFSGDTVRLGIEKAIFEAAAEITKVSVVQGRGSGLLTISSPDTSPFARPWEDAGPRETVPEGGTRVVELAKASVLLTAIGGELRAYANACAHLGMPLDDAELRDGVLTCPYHGFRYALDTGECLTAPDVQLPRYPARVEDGRVLVQVP